MTTIACRNGVMAADSRVTYEGEASGTRLSRCTKMYRKAGDIVGLAGETAPGLIFLDWYGTGRTKPQSLLDGEADFQAMVLTAKGILEYDKWCRGERMLHGRFWAIGSGAKAALGAMHMGADARRAVEIACKIDPYSSAPITTMRLDRDR